MTYHYVLNIGKNSEQQDSATVSEHDLLSAARSDGYSCPAAAVNSVQSRNPTEDRGFGAIGMHGTAERTPEHPKGEGIDSNGSSQASQNRRGRDDPATPINDQSTKMLKGGMEVSL